MFHPDQISRATTTEEPAIAQGEARGCLIDGCPCRDARIVSHRRGAFFAYLAREHGQTADRVIAPEPGWTLSTGANA
jgi:hypothetical protein